MHAYVARLTQFSCPGQVLCPDLVMAHATLLVLDTLVLGRGFNGHPALDFGVHVLALDSDHPASSVRAVPHGTLRRYAARLVFLARCTTEQSKPVILEPIVVPLVPPYIVQHSACVSLRGRAARLDAVARGPRRFF